MGQFKRDHLNFENFGAALPLFEVTPVYGTASPLSPSGFILQDSRTSDEITNVIMYYANIMLATC